MKKIKYFAITYFAIYFLTGIITSDWSILNIVKLILQLYLNFFHGVEFFAQIFIWPNFAYLPEVIKPLIESITMAYISVFIAIPFAIPIALLASARINKNKFSRVIVRFIIALDRSLPTYLKAAIFVSVIGVGIWSGILALTLYAIFYIARQLTQLIDSADLTPLKYGKHITNGFSSKVLFFYDQVFFQLLSVVIFTFEINLKSSVIIGVVGAGGIGTLIQYNIDWRMFANVGAILVMVFLLIALIEIALTKLKKVIAYE